MTTIDFTNKITLGANQPFILAVLISKHDKEKAESELSLKEKFEIRDYDKAPSMIQVFVEVKNIKEAVNILNKLP